MKAGALIARTCRLLRQEAGWTQAELARRMDVHRSTVSRWERDGRGMTDERFLKLTDLLSQHLHPE